MSSATRSPRPPKLQATKNDKARVDCAEELLERTGFIVDTTITFQPVPFLANDLETERFYLAVPGRTSDQLRIPIAMAIAERPSTELLAFSSAELIKESIKAANRDTQLYGKALSHLAEARVALGQVEGHPSFWQGKREDTRHNLSQIDAAINDVKDGIAERRDFVTAVPTGEHPRTYLYAAVLELKDTRNPKRVSANLMRRDIALVLHAAGVFEGNLNSTSILRVRDLLREARRWKRRMDKLADF